MNSNQRRASVHSSMRTTSSCSPRSLAICDTPCRELNPNL
jgi:hypothetical protein